MGEQWHSDCRASIAWYSLPASLYFCLAYPHGFLRLMGQVACGLRTWTESGRGGSGSPSRTTCWKRMSGNGSTKRCGGVCTSYRDVGAESRVLT